jgi:hypothetical protein
MKAFRQGKDRPRNDAVPAWMWVFGGGLLVLAAVALGWSWRGPTDQEFLANVTRAQDFWRQQLVGGFWTWWSPHYLGGGSLAPAWGSMVVHLWLLAWTVVLGWEAAGVSFAVALVLAAGTGFAFVRVWSGSSVVGLWAGVLYALAPSLWIRSVAVEHVVVVLAMVIFPLFLRAVVRLAREPEWRTAAGAGLTLALLCLTYTKLAVVSLPVAGLLWAWETSNRGTWGEQFRVPVVGTGLVVFGWLGVLPLLPLLRESGEMIVFALAPLAGWQEVFALQSGGQLLDRLGALSVGFAAEFAASTGQGGFYVGSAGLAILLAWWMGRQSLRFGPKRKCGLGNFFLPTEELRFARQALGLLLFCFWLASGPGGVLRNHFRALEYSVDAISWVVLPLWGGLVLASWLVWWLIVGGQENPGRVRLLLGGGALLVFWLVPGFRLVELLPFFDNLRAPFDFWQVLAPIFFSALAAMALVLLYQNLLSPVLRVAIGGLLVFLAGWDVGGQVLRQREQVLPVAVWEDWLAVQAKLGEAGQDEQGLLWPVSGRYFFATAPFLSGRGLVTEAFQNYLQLRGYATLLAAGQGREEHGIDALRLAGAGWIWQDKENAAEAELAGAERVFSRPTQDLWRMKEPLAPGFFARRVVLVQRGPVMDDYPAMLEAARFGLVPVERPELNQLDAHVGGVVVEGNLILGEEEEKPESRDWSRVAVERSADGTMVRVLGPESPERPDAEEVGWVVLTQPWHRDWQVRTTDDWSQAERAFGALLAAETRPGAEVEFRFVAPWWYSWSAWLAVLGWVAVGPVFWLTRKSRRWQENPSAGAGEAIV